MKALVMILALSSIMAFAHAGPEFICSIRNAKRVISTAEAYSKNDKNRHCTVSCMLALKCNDQEVLMVGMLKEFKDLFGPGNAEPADFKADYLGVSLAAKGAATTDKQCLAQCDLYYRK